MTITDRIARVTAAIAELEQQLQTLKALQAAVQKQQKGSR
jgi:hypothetical protein